MRSKKFKISIIIIMLTISIASTIGISNVFAAINGDGAPLSGNISSGGASGIGVTYSIHAYGYRVSLLKKDGDHGYAHDSKSIDYWSPWPWPNGYTDYGLKGKGFVTGHNQNSSNTTINKNAYAINGATNVKYYAHARPKTLRDSATLVHDKTSYPLATDDIYKQYYREEFYLTGKFPNGTNHGSANISGVSINIPSFVNMLHTNDLGNKLTYALLKSLEQDVKNYEKTKDDKYYEVFARFIKDMTGKDYEGQSNLDIVYSVSDSIIVIEPLMAVGSTGGTASMRIVYAGTPYDVNKLGYFNNPELPYLGAWFKNNFLNPVVWNTAVNAGIKACTRDNVNMSIASLNSPDGCVGAFTIDVGTDIITDPCPDLVKKAYNKWINHPAVDYNSKKQYNLEVTSACQKQGGCPWLKYGTYQDYDINPATITSCKLDCDTYANSHKGDSDIQNKLRTGWSGWLPKSSSSTLYYIDYFKRYGIENNNHYCSKASMSCEGTLNKIKKAGKLNLTTLDYLYKDTGMKYNFLNIEVLRALNPEVDDDALLEMANCESVPECTIESTKAKCNNTNHMFTISDFTTDNSVDYGTKNQMTLSRFAKLTSPKADKNCLNTNVAYNMIKKSDGTIEPVTSQTSVEITEYGSPSKPATCWEEVTFMLPLQAGTEENPVIAGTTFRWSTDGDFNGLSSNLFGEMTVHRFCTITKYTDGSTFAQIGSQWANVIGGKSLIGAIPNTTEESAISHSVYDATAKINPKITLYYKQALPTIAIGNRNKFEEVNGVNLDVELYHVKSRVYQRKDDGTLSNVLDDSDEIDYEMEECNDGSTLAACMEVLECPNHPRRTTLTADHYPEFFKNGGVIETTANYKIVYNDKFYWYSDKSEYSKRKTKTELETAHEDVENAKYEAVGYGLPTSFVTPTNYNPTEPYGYIGTAADGEGKMYAVITNVGTKTGVGETGDVYHFNRVLDIAIDDEDPIKSTPGIVYSCGFVIKNNLYCTEGNCNGGGSKTPPGGGGGGGGKTYHTPDGLDIVFRTITLIDSYTDVKKVFPGRSGSGRQRGLNWTTMYGYDLSNSDLAKLLSPGVYAVKPLYKITLDTDTITKIRKTNTTESYTQMNDYVFEKTLVTSDDIDAIFAQTLLMSCSNKGRLKSVTISETEDDYDPEYRGCFKAQYFLSIYAKMMVNIYDTDEVKDVEYTYAASPFLTDLAKGKYGNKLKGACFEMDGMNDTSKRAKEYAGSLGC